MFKVDLGSKVKTKVTKQVGIAISRSENLYGCNRYYIQPEADKSGKANEGFWTDEADLEVITPKKVEAKPSKNGGPMSKVR